jgi:hypothetical protein
LLSLCCLCVVFLSCLNCFRFHHIMEGRDSEEEATQSMSIVNILYFKY